MPTYTVRTTTGRLNGDARATLARAITTAHTAATGAQGFFAQVVFEEVDADRHFVGGAPIADELVFVHGQIRAGRTPEQKAALLDALGGAVREALGVPAGRCGSTSSTCRPRTWSSTGTSCPRQGTRPRGWRPSTTTPATT